MFFKSLILMTCCLVLMAVAHPLYLQENDNDQLGFVEIEEPWTLVRRVRSPDDDNEQKNEDWKAGIKYEEDPRTGRTASAYYNQNLYTSDDGRFKVEGQAQASRNYDYNRNDYGGFVRGSWSF